MNLSTTLPALALACAMVPSPALRAEPLRQRIAVVPAPGAAAPVSGSVWRALDPTGQLPGRIAIHYELHPQRNPALPSAGTIVAIEGGPGYGSTASRAGYLALFAPLLQDRQLLLVDSRGTGRSGAIRCPALQDDPFYQPQNVAACAAQLGAQAALYGSALAADDLAAVLDALHIGRIDLYGDSYGTFLAQAFAGRHPARLRSVVLDAAYAVIGADPWYPEASPQARSAFDAACAQSPACAAQPGPSMDRIQALLAQLRARPVRGRAPDGDGTLQDVTADARGLAYVMFSNASGPVVYRELDAAARAWAQGDTAPLLRLVAENQTVATSGSGAAVAFSAGLFAAVSCADYPQIYRMTDPVEWRMQQSAAAIAARQATAPDVYAPFTIDEFLTLPQDYSVLNLCLPWPVPAAAFPPAQPVPPDAVFPDVPVLVLSGEMDSLTPPAQGAQAAALFARARQVRVANSFHVTALGDLDGCASTLVRRFIEDLSPGDTACAAAVPAYPVVAAFARRTADLPAARPAAGNEGTPNDLRVVSAALGAAGDALARWWVNYDGAGVGLRGGRFRYQPAGDVTRFELTGLRFTEDLPVSGSVRWNSAGQHASASLAVPEGTLQAHWSTRGSGARAKVQGWIGGRRISATTAAP